MSQFEDNLQKISPDVAKCIFAEAEKKLISVNTSLDSLDKKVLLYL